MMGRYTAVRRLRVAAAFFAEAERSSGVREAAAFLADAERADAGREAEAAPPFLPPSSLETWVSGTPRPLPDLLPPPDSLFTVAQARRSASSSAARATRVSDASISGHTT